MKRHAPAAARNREPIAEVLAGELPKEGLVLEIASGTGEHAVYFAGRFPSCEWQPSDPDPDARRSIAAWREEASLPNLLQPLRLDAASDTWPVDRADAMVCINMVHISPVASAEGLFAGAGRLLDAGAKLFLYGPFIEQDVPTVQSNLDFDASLKARDPAWGLREVDWLDELAASNGLARVRRVAMPANNLVLVYRKT